MEGYSLHCCLPVLLWLPSQCSWRGRPLVILRILVFKHPFKSFSISFFRCPATQTQTVWPNLKNCSGAKTEVPGCACRNVLGFSVLLISCSTFCPFLYSLFTPTSFAPFRIRLLIIFPSSLDSCIQVTFLPYLVLHSIPPTVHLSCFSLLLAAVCLIYSFSSFPVYLLAWILEM